MLGPGAAAWRSGRKLEITGRVDQLSLFPTRMRQRGQPEAAEAIFSGTIWAVRVKRNLFCEQEIFRLTRARGSGNLAALSRTSVP